MELYSRSEFDRYKLALAMKHGTLARYANRAASDHAYAVRSASGGRSRSASVGQSYAEDGESKVPCASEARGATARSTPSSASTTATCSPVSLTRRGPSRGGGGAAAPPSASGAIEALASSTKTAATSSVVGRKRRSDVEPKEAVFVGDDSDDEYESACSAALSSAAAVLHQHPATALQQSQPWYSFNMLAPGVRSATTVVIESDAGQGDSAVR
jgi:hypothetical protein